MGKLSSLFGGGSDDAAAQRRAEEEERQRRIGEGVARINAAFGGFNRDYFDARRTAYNDFYLPQLEEQYADAQEKQLYALADAGLLKSTTRNEVFSDLARDYELERGNILTGGERAAADLRSRINDERSALIARLEASANPDLAASGASAAVRALRDSPPNFSPLATVLTPIAVGASNYLEGRRNTRALGEDAGPSAADPRRSGGTYSVR